MELIEALNKWWHKPKPEEFYELFLELSKYVEVNIPPETAAEKMAPAIENPLLKAAMLGIAKDLRNGVDIAAAFRKQNVFPDTVPSLIASGARSGELRQVFVRIAENMLLQTELYGKVNAALLSPKMGLAATVLSMYVFTDFVMPQFVQSYHDAGIEMSVVMQMYLAIFGPIFDYWYITLVVIFLLYRGAKMFIKLHSGIVAGWKLRMPIYGPLHRILIQHQFCASMCLLLRNGISITEACNYTAPAVDNALMGDSIIDAGRSIRNGMGISQAFRSNNTCKVYEPGLISFIETGELTGNLPDMLNSRAGLYELKIKEKIEKVSKQLTIITLIPLLIFAICFYFFSYMPIMDYFSKTT